MAKGIWRFKRLMFGILALCLLAAIAVGIYFATKPHGSGHLTLSAEDYQRLVADFETGWVALDVNFQDEAGPALQRAAKIAPDEPAIWADLALWYLRAGNYKHAEAALTKAHSLAPDNSYITTLLAVWDGDNGRPKEALERLQQAVQQSPDNVRARYGLYEDMEMRGTPELIAAAKEQLQAILRVEPSNPLIRTDLAILALRQGERAVAAESLKALKNQVPAWPSPLVREQYAAVMRAFEKGDPRTMLNETAGLSNALQSMPAGLTTVVGRVKPSAGSMDPLTSFVRLPSPAPTAGAADQDMEFVETTVAENAVNPHPWTAAFEILLEENAPPAPLRTERAALFAANGSEVRRIDKAGTAFAFPGGPRNVAPSPNGILPIDWNNDFRTDFLLAGAGGIRFMEQGPDGRFSDVTAKTTLSSSVLHKDYYGAWTLDVEMDGDLDILLAPRHGSPVVLRNNGNGTWTVINPFVEVSDVRAFVWADLDHDGIPDVAMLDASGKVHVFFNERAGRFRPWSAQSVVPVGGEQVLALTAADVLNAGAFDLILMMPQTRRLIRHAWNKVSHEWETTQLVAWPDFSPDGGVGSVRLFIGDFDNNGSLDVLVSQKTVCHLWLSSNAGEFSLAPKVIAARVCEVTGLGEDSRLHMLGISSGPKISQYRTRGTKSYRGLTVRPRAKKLADGRINSFGIGGEMQARAGLLVQTQLVSGPVVHFGLGEHPIANVIRIVWANGSTQAEFDSESGKPVDAVQRLKGSCPWLFAFDGQHMCFVTDVLWRSPLGLRINAQDTAGTVQTEDWVKIRGDQLRPHDGYYDLRITAELWETHFFDMARLMAVDHPIGTDIFVDERFAVPPPALKVQLTTPPRPVRRAVDDNGQDVTEIVRALDGRYLDTFGRGPFQGLTRDHCVEVELNDPPGAGPLWLIAQGWIHPTDSSINVAIAQAHAGPPRSLSLEIPDGKGGWRAARENLGFPAGKTKTILINLDGLFPAGAPHRLRLRTNMEIYWDRIATARGLDDGELRTRRLVPEKAELRFRGFSTVHQANPSSPELPDYNHLNGNRQRWRDLIGYYTRFGDVRALLEKVDDRYVIMNAGDELALHFPELPPPQAGWTRDYVFISDGWEKDGDYNTGFSNTVLPLPSHDNPAYNTPPGQLEDDPVYRGHRGDWTRYHTRYVTPDVFLRGLMPSAR